MAGEGKRGEACEGGEEGGDAGGCIAACKFLVSRSQVEDVSDSQTFWSLCRESISLGAPTSLAAFELPCVSACRLVCQQKMTRVAPEPLSALKGGK